MSLLLKRKKKCIRTEEPRCHSVDKRGLIFPLFLREDFLFPFLIIFLNALQVAVLHVDSDAVEFNELWAKAERLSGKINEWQQLTFVPSTHVQMPMSVGYRQWHSPAALHTGASLRRFQAFLPLFFLFYLSPGDLWLRRKHTICASEP